MRGLEPLSDRFLYKPGTISPISGGGISQHIYKGKIILYNNQNLIPSLSLWLLSLPFINRGGPPHLQKRGQTKSFERAVEK